MFAGFHEMGEGTEMSEIRKPAGKPVVQQKLEDEIDQTVDFSTPLLGQSKARNYHTITTTKAGNSHTTIEINDSDQSGTLTIHIHRLI